MSLLIMVTLHDLTCGMYELLHTHNIIFLYMDLFRLVIFMCGKSALNILMGIKLLLQLY